MWGDSTMDQQSKALYAILGGTQWRVLERAIWNEPVKHDNVQLMNGTADQMDAAFWSSTMCSEMTIRKVVSTWKTGTIRLVSATCQDQIASVTMMPAVMEVLRLKHVITHQTLNADHSLFIVGGSGLQHLHRLDSCSRDWEHVKVVSDASFEKNLKYGLAKIQEIYPEAKLGYLNTHHICNSKCVWRTGDEGNRARACDGGDVHHNLSMCFSGLNVPTEERKQFMETLHSGYGSDRLAAREAAVLSDPDLSWKLVDANSITKRASCDRTDDGTHYDIPTVMDELLKALRLQTPRSVLRPGELPVLQATTESKVHHAEWHAYFESVYGHPVDGRVDLNKFEWFYHGAPLPIVPRLLMTDFHAYGLKGTPHCPDTPDNEIDCPLQEGEAWYRNRFVPQYALGQVGYFVARNMGSASPSPTHVRRDFVPDKHFVVDMPTSPFEVMRALCPWERGEVWFYPVIGTGIYFDPNALARWKWRVPRTAEFQYAGNTRRTELVVSASDLDGKTGCPRSSQEAVALPLRSGFDARFDTCSCDEDSMILNCGLPHLPRPDKSAAYCSTAGFNCSLADPYC
jgi:hypothetical protein